MAAAEEVVVSLCGGAPWGFRLQGGAEQQKPLQVAKVRRRSKACRAGLKEQDELLSIGERRCSALSHAQAMSLLDLHSSTLQLRVKRPTSGFHSSSSRMLSPPLDVLVPSRMLSPPMDVLQTNGPSARPLAGGVTSPPDSEAYYGETDSDADTAQALVPRRQRRTSPHARSPARHDDHNEEETSEMSGYESAPDAAVTQWDVPYTVGVPKRELVYQPLPPDWETPTHTPPTLTPHTLTPRTLSPAPDLGLGEGDGEGDSGFQEAAGSGAGVALAGPPLTCPPLVSPERAKEALMLVSRGQLVPMVGPQEGAVNDELSTTYKDKARQAKLQRGESQVEKQVKEARTKCRSIASLLTDAPNPNSKGVLMFKKRRQRAKKYTLTCFGKAPEDKGSETEGETEEEGGSSILSGSEVDEEGFSASYDPTWDSGYLDLLDRRSSACPSTTPTTPTSNPNLSLDFSTNPTPPFGFSTSTSQSPKLERIAGLDSLAYHDTNLENGVANQPINTNYTPMSPLAMPLTNGGAVEVSRASVVLTPPSQTPLPSQNTQQENPGYDTSATFSPGGNVLNRTARPFAPGSSAPSRPSVTSVMFRPPLPKPVFAPAPPVNAVSMMTLSSPRQSDSRRAVSSTSLYIPARSTNGNSSEISSIQSTPSSLSSATTVSQPTVNHANYPPPSSINLAQPFSHQIPQQLTSQNYQYASNVPPISQTYTPQPTYLPPSPMYSAQPYIPPTPQQLASPATPNCQYASNDPSFSQPFIPEAAHVPMQPPPATPVNPYLHTQLPMSPSHVQPSPQVPSNEALASREQRIAVPATRTGILTEARKRNQKKPMFTALQSKDVNPNPDLLSMVQNMDDRFTKGPNVEPNSGGVPVPEAGHESGPEEDWLRLGAEACNFMQAQRQPKPPPVAPKPKGSVVSQMTETPQTPVLGGKGGQLFAKRQHRMDRYVVERSPSVATMPYSPAQTREPSPTPSLPSTWKYSSSIRAPPPINYNPLLSPSCPLVAQKKQETPKAGSVKKPKSTPKPVDLMNHKPYQLNSTLFSYGGGGGNHDVADAQPHRGTPGGVHKTARVFEIKRFSTPPPTTTGPALKVIAPRAATTLGQPMWRSDIASPPPQASATPYQAPHQRQQWDGAPLSPPPPAPSAPLPQLPTFSSPLKANQAPGHAQAGRQFKSVPNLSPMSPPGFSSQANPQFRVPKPRFSTSNLGLQPSVWQPGSALY
ncbi:synaptopodin 2-like protein [Eucyclogobius newberryi]|uniref:synaptopodin 2-like protein n=1 Tax=Eucyclogobius newberryi TaxID=166745 RepID=UPI003B5B286B